VLRPAAYDAIEADTAAIKEYGAEIFAFGTLIQREKLSRNAVKNILSECEFKEIFCDINLRKDCYDRESCLLCLENATILKLSDEEEPLLAEFGFYESSEKRMCPVRPALEFRMELHPYEERQTSYLHSFYQSSVRRDTA
jgi:hypothetical protein